MLQLSATYFRRPILSLRTGGRIGFAAQPVINPNTLKIEGWYCTQLHEKEEFILPISQVRDIIPKGIVVDDHDALTHPNDLVRNSDIFALRFSLEGKTVRTENGSKLGKILDFAVDDMTFLVQKLYVQPTLFKGLLQQQFIIDRNNIVEITDTHIVVKDGTVPIGNTANAPAQA